MASAVGLVSYIFAGFGALAPSAPIINISTGKIQGLVSTSRDGRPYYEYLGIPYAKSPLNELRFEPPVPIIEKWKGIFKANHYALPCLQLDTLLTGAIKGSEDCLFLNVASPRIGGKLPVIVWIGSGDSKDFGTKYFMDEDVVVVTLNFRLHVLGFLNTANDQIRGNMGYKDQVMVLRWIQENIKKFGGDPDRVTLMGEGPGAISVHFHILSPLSKGLFHSAISMSGNAACPFAFIRDPLSQAQRFGKKAGCPTRNTSALVRCLRKKKARDLIYISKDLMSPVHEQEDYFTGTVEKIKREDTFLHESPFDILELGNFNKVPWIVGINSGEGRYLTSRFLAYPDIQANVGRRWKEYAPILSHFDPEKLDVTDKLRQYYFGSSRYMNPGYDIDNLTQMISDGNYFHPTHFAATRHARHAPTFVYYLTYETRRFPSICSAFRAVTPDDWTPSEFKIIATTAEDLARKYISKQTDTPDLGICPSQQLPLLWNTYLLTEVWRSHPDFHFSKVLIRTFADFAANEEGSKLKFDGLPWPSIGRKGPPLMYMKLDSPPRMIDEPFAKYLNFWDSLNIRNGYETRNF